MWHPANKAALPSQEEAMFAKEAIRELELDLKKASELLKQMRSRVSKLTIDLAERKAWIAPIRKIPVEILSKIFISASELEDLAPLTIMEVCHLWHAIVLSTPRAWSLIYASKSRHESYLEPYVSTFLGRSRPCLLHISIPYSVGRNRYNDESDEEASIYPVPVLMANLSRIQCLSIPSEELAMLRQAHMPNLTRLRIEDAWGGHVRGKVIEPFFINRSQFPRLQSVNSTSSPWSKSLPFTWFPPLQYLAIRMDADFTWLDVGRNCANTLKSLKLARHGPIQLAHIPTIVFPKLESLKIEYWSRDAGDAPWALQMLTPALTSYEELSRGSARGSVHGDVKNVTSLRSDRIHDLSNYVNLRVYRLVPASESLSEVWANQLAEQFDQSLNTCPALQTVLFYVKGGSMSDSIKNRIIEPIKNARPAVEVVITNHLSGIPGSMEESSCAPDMPCCEY